MTTAGPGTVTGLAGIPVPPVTIDLPGVQIGCDVVDVVALGRRLDRTPDLLHRLFSEAEVADATRGGVAVSSIVALRRLAARAAAKEAAYKALRQPGIGFRDLEVRIDHATGAPSLLLRGEPHPAAVSLSHDGDVAMAVVAHRVDQPDQTDQPGQPDPPAAIDLTAPAPASTPNGATSAPTKD